MLNLPLIKFPIFMVSLFALTRWQPFIANVRRPYCEKLAVTISWVFNHLGIETTQVNSDVTSAMGHTLTIIPACDGLILICFFVAGVATISPRLVPRPYLRALGAIALLVALNWVRLAILTLAVFFRPALFEPLHLYFLQGFLVVSVVVLFLLWLRGLSPEDLGDDRTPVEA